MLLTLADFLNKGMASGQDNPNRLRYTSKIYDAHQLVIPDSSTRFSGDDLVEATKGEGSRPRSRFDLRGRDWQTALDDNINTRGQGTRNQGCLKYGSTARRLGMDRAAAFADVIRRAGECGLYGL